MKTVHRCERCGKAIRTGRWYCNECLEHLKYEHPRAAWEEQADRDEYEEQRGRHED